MLMNKHHAMSSKFAPPAELVILHLTDVGDSEHEYPWEIEYLLVMNVPWISGEVNTIGIAMHGRRLQIDCLISRYTYGRSFRISKILIVPNTLRRLLKAISIVVETNFVESSFYPFSLGMILLISAILTSFDISGWKVWRESGKKKKKTFTFSTSLD